MKLLFILTLLPLTLLAYSSNMHNSIAKQKKISMQSAYSMPDLISNPIQTSKARPSSKQSLRHHKKRQSKTLNTKRYLRPQIESSKISKISKLSKPSKPSKFFKRSAPAVKISKKCRSLGSGIRIHPTFKEKFSITEQIFIKQTIKNLSGCRNLPSPQVLINLLYYKVQDMTCVEHHLGDVCLASFTTRARRLSRSRNRIGGHLFSDLFDRAFGLNMKYRAYVKLYSY